MCVFISSCSRFAKKVEKNVRIYFIVFQICKKSGKKCAYLFQHDSDATPPPKYPPRGTAQTGAPSDQGHSPLANVRKHKTIENVNTEPRVSQTHIKSSAVACVLGGCCLGATKRVFAFRDEWAAIRRLSLQNDGFSFIAFENNKIILLQKSN